MARYQETILFLLCKNNNSITNSKLDLRDFFLSCILDFSWNGTHSTRFSKRFYKITNVLLSVPGISSLPSRTFKYVQVVSQSIGSLSNHDDDDNKNPTNLHIWQWKTVFLHALHVHFSFFDIL